MSKKYTTNFLEDTNGSTGTTNQVLVSTATGVDWVDGSGSGIIGGPYLPLSAGSGFPLTGDLYITKAATPLIQLTDTTNSKTLLLGVDDANAFIRTGAGENFYLQVNGGTNAITILNNSNVGIGTTSPSYKLAVYGSTSGSEIVASFGNGNAQNEYTAIGLSGFIASNGATKAGLALKRTSTYGTGELHFLNNNTLDNSDITLSDSKMMINAIGNVGIGTTSPGQNLEISGQGNVGVRLTSTDSTTSTLQFADSDDANVGLIQYNHSTNYMLFRTNDGDRMRIDSSGNVGIGITSPGAKLDVYNSSGNVYQAFIGGSVSKLMINGNLSGGGVALQSAAANSSSDYSICPSTVYDLFMQSCGGNVMIGSGTPTAKLEVNGQTKTKSLTYLEPTGNSEYRGEIVYFGAFESGIFDTNGGELVCLGNVSGNPTWRKADDNTATRATGMLGITLGSTVAAGVLVRGFARSTAYNGFADGGKCYISATDGDMTTTAPTGNNKYLRIVGYVVDSITGAAEIYFCPDNTYVQITV